MIEMVKRGFRSRPGQAPPGQEEDEEEEEVTTGPPLCPFLTFCATDPKTKKRTVYQPMCTMPLQFQAPEGAPEGTPGKWIPEFCVICLNAKNVLATSGRDPIHEPTVPVGKDGPQLAADFEEAEEREIERPIAPAAEAKPEGKAPEGGTDVGSAAPG